MNKGKAEYLSDLLAIGIDIGKDVFHLVGFDAEGNLVLRRRICPASAPVGLIEGFA